MTVYLLATLDTKGTEAGYVRDELQLLGIDVKLLDTGAIGSPTIQADIPREAVFEAAGTSLAAVVARKDRGEAVTQAAAGAAALIRGLHAAGKVSGVLGLGGSAGTTIGTSAMRVLPIGIPKLMISTLASGQVRHYVRDKDVMMLNSVVDISGLNRISRSILSQAARAMAGMVKLPREMFVKGERPLIAATMFGVTTPCIEMARAVLEESGYEVMVFHATGNGGEAMESLIAEGTFAGVLDITTTELADELVGGILSAGPQRLTAAAKAGVPQVISVGALDMVNFGARDTVPEKFAGRTFYQHNANVTLMRTTPEENAMLGEEIGEKAQASKGPVSILLPLLGVSAIDREGQPFDAPAARTALFEGIRQHHGAVELVEMNRHINDAEFAQAAARKLLALIGSRARA